MAEKKRLTYLIYKDRIQIKKKTFKLTNDQRTCRDSSQNKKIQISNKYINL